ncbi:class III lanthionine synthetase LanKC [Spiractinospora alimapuensis]|uniref:class III lanthionine synthetase LanKC n=1 Tax=Spiractinospora alimapuensis TaxID=2820884 RepID=UPI001EEA3694|nr:class III lanthionine synthetase LanKC [Spiractinospora alimapuensis]QVQ51837.1 class III lanthionine synthetase LanKC [Spiractinospora alimapuensis]
MREALHLYTWTKDLFFDTPENHNPADNVHYEALVGPIVEGQDVRREGPWCVVSPPDEELPGQGWKIHVSTVPAQAAQVLDITARYCVERSVSFKFLRDRALFLAYSGKNAPRTSSGKFLCLYPRDEEALEHALDTLDARLAGFRGPYILTDLRWRAGPLFLRYGAFESRYTYQPSGSRVLAMRDAEGRTVADTRGIPFRPPEWAPLPDRIETGVDRGTVVGDFPFTVTAAVQFSNAGGVYRGTHKATGQSVVLKEARSNTGWDDGTTDSVARLRQEEDALRALTAVPGIPRVVAGVQHWEHYFLAVSEMPGERLATWRALNNPLLQTCHSAEDLKRYRSDVETIVAGCRRVVDEMHRRGWAHRDLNPNNILVDDDLTVRVVDFEMCAPVDVTDRPLLGVAGYATDMGDGRARDLASLRMLTLDLFLPLVSHISLDTDLRGAIADTAVDWFGLPTDYFTAPAAEDPTDAAAGPTRWRAGPSEARDLPREVRPLCGVLARSILATARPARRDRLFPGDPAQFRHRWAGGGLAHGTAGVLWTLRAGGVEPPTEFDSWLARLVETDIVDPAIPPGLWEGAAGIAWYLAAHGDPALARHAMDPVHRDLDATTDPSLRSGLAGVGLMAAYLAGDAELGTDMRAVGARCAERIAEELLDEPGLAVLPGGLLDGWSGVALFLTRWAERTGDDRWLDVAESALRRDLDRCATTANGDLRVDDGRRHLPYLGVGSMGIAVAASALLTHREVSDLAAAVPRLASGAAARFTALPGVFSGFSGLVLGALALGNRCEASTLRGSYPELLHLFLCRDADGAHLVGDLGVRASCDFATGSAGALATLELLRAPDFVKLPFLGLAPATPMPEPDRDGVGVRDHRGR